MTKVEVIDAYKCTDCGAIIDPSIDDVEEPLYECGSCGTRFRRSGSYTGDNHQCPACLKFAGKVADQSCPECEEGEVEAIQAYEDQDGELVEDEPELGVS